MGRRFKTISSRISPKGKIYKKNVIYPEIPESINDVYVISSYGDRYDILAQEFYKDAALWWIIASANTYDRGSLNITPGIQLRIPGDKSQAIQLFEQVNANR